VARTQLLNLHSDKLGFFSTIVPKFVIDNEGMEFRPVSIGQGSIVPRQQRQQSHAINTSRDGNANIPRILIQAG
jgi:hypothetical protein